VEQGRGIGLLESPQALVVPAVRSDDVADAATVGEGGLERGVHRDGRVDPEPAAGQVDGDELAADLDALDAVGHRADAKARMEREQRHGGLRRWNQREGAALPVRAGGV
jgi:hypothetical protein